MGCTAAERKEIHLVYRYTKNYVIFFISKWMKIQTSYYKIRKIPLFFQLSGFGEKWNEKINIDFLKKELYPKGKSAAIHTGELLPQKL